MDNPTKNAELIDRMRAYASEPWAHDNWADLMTEAAALIESQDRDLAMQPHSLSGLYEIREGFGFTKLTSLNILAGTARELKHVIGNAAGEKCPGEHISDQARRLAKLATAETI